ncbi:MAG TPA: PLP-dependent transferase [Candidatus Dormibacteraeota bacterium]|nr:PLP-dependent transferase [Candidatus Dormibacteraeota bacterium]
MKLASRAVHAGREDKARAPLAPSISTAAVHVYEDLEDYDAVARGDKPGHYYGRNSNENRSMLERAVADMEGAESGLVAASGMAALYLAILALAPQPATIVATRELYGGTLNLLRQDLEPLGYKAHFVDMQDLEAVRRALDGAGLVIAETITNPMCRVVDIAALARMTRAAAVPLLVDNTFATPIFCRPIELGADVVMHSATKYIGGHSDLLAGVVVGTEQVIAAARARSVRTGATLGAFDAWLALRGLRTLDVRMRRHAENAAALADALSSLPAVKLVHYGGLGGMLACDLEGGRDAVQRMMSRFRMVVFAASLGGVETTISYPLITSHRSLSDEERAELGVTAGTVRVSAGIESADDIVEDFVQAIG